MAAPSRETYFYGIILNDSGEQFDLEGVQNQSVRKISSGRLGAVVSDVDTVEDLGTPNNLVAHTTVLDRIGANEPILPLAFGTVVPDPDDITRDVLDPNEQKYYDSLVRLKGHAQYTLLVRFDRERVLREIVEENGEAAELRAAIAGTSEDETRPQRIRLGEIIVAAFDVKRSTEAEPLLERIEKVTAEHVVREAGQAEDVVEVAVLIENDATEDFESAVEELAEQNQQRLVFRLLGPQAPYDFLPETSE
ncbi:GvpL/GvpF family gas vesicle protein [Rothia uropygialis]|uniref:GvpL/GvpF family gas vesicle protein n=1 Tax=Kocuria sp. 36 TaxID=1415402 RepID=UPI0013EC2D17|nr:GvpL/GvpF family gas vesicle protein [Kocuria sp. 36]